MSDYPAAPWRLAGTAYLSAWRVPPDALPRVPGVVTPVRLAGAALVVTAWIDYTPPGRLSYHELLAVVAVRHGARLAGTITEIWVDSDTSLAGGRALWGIPKEKATLTFRHERSFTAAATVPGALPGSPGGDSPLASATFTPRRFGAPALRTAFSILQDGARAPRVSPVRARAAPRPAAARWTFAADGPLGYLAGRRPLASAQLRGVRLLFGAAGGDHHR